MSRTRWFSDCGTYEVWVQSRPTEGAGRVLYYAAKVIGQKDWLTDNETLEGARQACEDHKAGRVPPRPFATAPAAKVAVVETVSLALSKDEAGKLLGAVRMHKDDLYDALPEEDAAARVPVLERLEERLEDLIARFGA